MPTLMKRSWPAAAFAAVCLLVSAAAVETAAEDTLAKRYAAADANGDKKLSLDEFLKLPGEQPVLLRDFKLFDMDGNQSLSPEEFDSVPMGRPPSQRGALPDPIVQLAERAIAQMDETFGNWDQHPEKQIAVQQFVQSFQLSFPDPNSVAALRGQLQLAADENRNNQVSRDEARRFLEIQLGIRRSDGELLRFPTGQVVNNAVYVILDENGDLQISRDEFMSRWWHKEKLAEDWKNLDQNGNGAVTYEEYLTPAWHGVTDPVEEFRWYDTNLDARLDSEELLARSPDWNQTLARHAFPGFDLDRDGKLSLSEFRQLPQENLVLSWNSLMPDANRDGELQFSEFTVHDGRFPLLRLIFYLRMDTDGNGTLSPQEFTFKVFQPQGLYRLNADGTGWQQIFSSPQYPQVGSPKISRDGKMLLCDAVPLGQDGGRKMLLMTIDGKNVQDLGPGMMPTWSADGQQIAYSQQGVQTMDLATKTSKVLVQGGWGAQWSPDGKKIAFSQGTTVNVVDPESGEITPVLDAEQSPYQQIYWNMGWSADSQRLCFKGIRKEGGAAEIATVSLTDPSPDLKVHYSGQRIFSNNFTWSPDGKRIVFGMHAKEKPLMLMHEFNPATADVEPIPLPGADPSLRSDDSCWSPDGMFIILNAVAE